MNETTPALIEQNEVADASMVGETGSPDVAIATGE
jgi:hypothetical protein